MAENKCKKGKRSGAHGIARQAITTRNKARREKKQARIWKKRRDPERVAKLAQNRIERYLASRKRRGVDKSSANKQQQPKMEEQNHVLSVTQD